MSDFSKLQQINAIARELMKHGQASTMDEAMRKAKQQVDSGVALTPVEEIQIPTFTPASSGADTGASCCDGDMAKKLESIIYQQQSVISNLVNTVNSNSQAIAGMNAKISSMIAELADVKAKVDKIMESPVTPTPMKKKDAEEGQTQFKQPSPSQHLDTSTPPQGGTDRNHARTGNFQPNDVSIEKFFYFGPGGAKR